MTVAQLIERLQDFDPDAIVYVPKNTDGKNGTVQFVASMPHTHLSIPGICIHADVALLPGEMEEYVLEPGASDEDRQGES